MDRNEHLVTAPHNGDDFGVIDGPHERLGVDVGLVDEAVDRFLQPGDGAEHAALQSLVGVRGEEALDGIEP